MSYQPPENDPYGQPSATDPYAQAGADPYGQASADPYAAYGQPADPYGQASADPYAQPQGGYGYGQSAPATGYGQTGYPEPADPYAGGYQQPQDPYAQQQYGAVQPYGQPAPMGGAGPRPEMGYGQALKAFFQNYANFNGRASRSEWMWPWLTMSGAGVLMYILAAIAGASGSDTAAGIVGLLYLLFWLLELAVLLPALALTSRRLHDTGKSAAMMLVALIPFVGGIWLLVMLFGNSDPSGAQYDDPTGKQPATGA